MTGNSKLISKIFLTMAGVVFFATHAFSAEYKVTPVTIEPTQGGSATVLTVTNESSSRITIQARVFRWTQDQASDLLEPSSDVIVSPPLTNIAPGQSHVMRVAMTKSGPIAGEQAYRILIDEIPDATSARNEGVTLLLRQSLPAFFGTVPSSQSIVAFQLTQAGLDWRLSAVNRGQRRLRLNDVRISDADGAIVVAIPGLVGYVLAGSEMRWPVAMRHKFQWPLTIDVSTDQGPLRFVVRQPAED